jgi:hypothetical protein
MSSFGSKVGVDGDRDSPVGRGQLMCQERIAKTGVITQVRTCVVRRRTTTYAVPDRRNERGEARRGSAGLYLESGDLSQKRAACYSQQPGGFACISFGYIQCGKCKLSIGLFGEAAVFGLV